MKKFLCLLTMLLLCPFFFVACDTTDTFIIQSLEYSIGDNSYTINSVYKAYIITNEITEDFYTSIADEFKNISLPSTYGTINPSKSNIPAFDNHIGKTYYYQVANTYLGEIQYTYYSKQIVDFKCIYITGTYNKDNSFTITYYRPSTESIVTQQIKTDNYNMTLFV